MLTLYGLPVIYAMFFWWFSTGIIFYLDGLPVRTFKWSMLGATGVLGASLYTLWATSSMTGSAAAYAAFSAGLLAWGWQEISLYMGYVTGPRKIRCAHGCSGWRHFVHAIEVNLWHELSIVATALAIAAVTHGGVNQFGYWTFLILWSMHLSARLNVFLGVRNVSEEFVPDHMEVLKSFLKRKPMNLLFPISVTAATVGSVVLFSLAMSAQTALEIAGFSLLAAIMTLALLEHWFLVLPLPVEKIFEWTLSSRKRRSEPHNHTRIAGTVELKNLNTKTDAIA